MKWRNTTFIAMGLGGAYLTARARSRAKEPDSIRAIRKSPQFRLLKGWCSLAFWTVWGRLLTYLESQSSSFATRRKMGGRNEVSMKGLTDVQREILGRLFDRCDDIREKWVELVSTNIKYPTVAEMGEVEEINEEIREEIDNLFALLAEDIEHAMNEFRIDPTTVVTLKAHLPDGVKDLFPVISVNGKPL